MTKIKLKKKPYAGQEDYAFHRVWSPSEHGGEGGFNKEVEGVNQSLKAVDREKANAELEGGETVIVPATDGLHEHYDVNGPRHTNGGVPLQLDPGSFVFSDTNKMKIKDPTILEYFGKKQKKEGFTPAEIAKQYKLNDLKNEIKNAEKNPHYDSISKDTNELMYQNYLNKLSALAMIQESKKGFPKGTPQFTQNMQQGGWKNYTDKTSGRAYTAPNGLDPEDFYNTPGLLEYMSNLNVLPGYDNDLNNAKDYTWGERHQIAYDNYYLPYKNKNTTPSSTPSFVPQNGPTKSPSVNNTGNNDPSAFNNINPNTFTAAGKLDKGNMQHFLPDRIAENAAFWNYGTVDKYNVGPIYNKYNPKYVNPTFVDPERSIQAQQALASVYGNVSNFDQAQLSKGVADTMANYDNQNQSIANSVNAANTGEFNKAQGINMEMKSNFWKEYATYTQQKGNSRRIALANLINTYTKGTNNAMTANMLEGNYDYSVNRNNGSLDFDPSGLYSGTVNTSNGLSTSIQQYNAMVKELVNSGMEDSRAKDIATSAIFKRGSNQVYDKNFDGIPDSTRMNTNFQDPRILQYLSGMLNNTDR